MRGCELNIPAPYLQVHHKHIYRLYTYTTYIHTYIPVYILRARIELNKPIHHVHVSNIAKSQLLCRLSLDASARATHRSVRSSGTRHSCTCLHSQNIYTTLTHTHIPRTSSGEPAARRTWKKDIFIYSHITWHAIKCSLIYTRMYICVYTEYIIEYIIVHCARFEYEYIKSCAYLLCWRKCHSHLYICVCVIFLIYICETG